MAVRWYTTVVDCRDHSAQAHWWAQVLRWEVVYESDDEAVVVAPAHTEPGLVFVPVPEAKTLKNRLHLDLRPGAADDHATELARLIALGAVPVDVGQGDRPWTVLADPEGNEFCLGAPVA